MNSGAHVNHWKLVEHIFHSALEFPLSDRAAYLARACGDDAGWLRGRRIAKQAPWAEGSVPMSPPRSMTACRAKARPIPKPFRLPTAANGPNNQLRISRPIPDPGS